MGLINKFLEINDDADRIINPQVFDGLGLLGGGAVDKFLQKCVTWVEIPPGSVAKTMSAPCITN